MTKHSLTGIISRIDEIQDQISLEMVGLASRNTTTFKDLEQRTLLQIRILIEAIERDLSARDLTGADLAIRSRRGYQWLKFLSDPVTLLSHLDTLQRVNLFLDRSKLGPGKTIRFTLYHMGSLYKLRHHEGLLEMTAQESFFTAPDRMIKNLVDVALDPSSKESRHALQEYTFSKEYQLVREKLEYLGIPRGSFASGNMHHLEASFQRVNLTYFGGKLDQPHLVWSRRLTHRKFGHYQWDTDTVMVSSSLDQESIPEMVVDFVVYHELLHKKLGARQANQNRIAHTQEFREAEGKFLQVDKARKHLNRLARKRARSS